MVDQPHCAGSVRRRHDCGRLWLVRRRPCSRFGRPQRWALEALSPDGQNLVVSSPASGCTRFEEWVVEETDVAVNIDALAWNPDGPAECTADLGYTTLEVVLEQPLGERALQGCQRNGPCFSLDDAVLSSVSNGETAVTAADGVIGILSDAGLRALDTTGELVSEIEIPRLQGIAAIEESTFVHTDRSNNPVGVDVRTGVEVWSERGRFIEADRNAIYSCCCLL